ncbi:glycosyltransferase family 39 protein [Candidatus Parcubacteria bacterium]|nr:glycosyltransferase family 39 protein [Candidatus Parcubacteria bacterium]
MFDNITARKNSFVVLFLFFLALLSGLFWSYERFGQSVPEIGGDDEYYNRLAVEFIEKGEFTSYKTDKVRAAVDPLYPLFITGVYKIFGINYNAVRVIQLLIFALTVVIVYLLAKEFANFKVSFFTAFVCALFYPLASYSGEFNKEILFTFLLVALIFFLVKGQNSNKFIWFALAGVFSGLAYLLNSIMLFFPIFVITGYMFFYGKRLFEKKCFINILIFSAISISCPLIIFLNFNYLNDARSASGAIFIERKSAIIEEIKGQYFDHFIGLFFGYYFAEKINTDIDEKLFLDFFPLGKKYAEARQKGVSDKEFASEQNSPNIKNLIKNPLGFLFTTFLDFIQFNGPTMPNKIISSGGPMQNMFINNGHAYIPDFVKTLILAVLRIIYWIFFGFIFYGIFKSAKTWKKFVMPYLIILYFNLLFSIIFGLARYAIPIYFFYIIFFTIGIEAFYRKNKYKYKLLLLR